MVTPWDDSDGSKYATQQGNSRCFELHLCNSISCILSEKKLFLECSAQGLREKKEREYRRLAFLRPP